MGLTEELQKLEKRVKQLECQHVFVYVRPVENNSCVFVFRCRLCGALENKPARKLTKHEMKYIKSLGDWFFYADR